MIIEEDSHHVATNAELIQGQDHLQGQIEALRSAFVGLLRAHAEGKPPAERIAAELTNWMEEAKAEPQPEPEIVAGFSAVREQLTEAMKPPN